MIEATELPRSAVRDALQTLQSIGWVSEMPDDEKITVRYALLAEPAAVSIKPLLDATVLDATHPKLAFLSEHITTLQNMSMANLLA